MERGLNKFLVQKEELIGEGELKREFTIKPFDIPHKLVRLRESTYSV